MENVKVTEEQAKTLLLFAHYARSYGKDEVSQDLYYDGCSFDWGDEDWWGGAGRRIESYGAIDNVIEEIISTFNVKKIFNDCDNRNTLTINIDCVERTIKISASETVFEGRPMGESMKLSEIGLRSIEEIFEYMGTEGYSEGVVDFSGGGDDGDIHRDIVYDKKYSGGLERDTLSFLYDWLGNFYGGWEINEGSQGYFTFMSDSKEIELYFEENVEETRGLGDVFYSKF